MNVAHGLRNPFMVDLSNKPKNEKSDKHDIYNNREQNISSNDLDLLELSSKDSSAFDKYVEEMENKEGSVFGVIGDFFDSLVPEIANAFNGKSAENAKGESFDDVFKEMSDKVPDSTSTIEEKELAISYIDRMLACEDIPNPEYWQNKKAVIQMEIASIKNNEAMQGSDNTDNTKNSGDIQNEFNDFTKTYGNENLKFDSPEDQFEYWMTYHNTCQSFIQRIMNCEDLPENVKAEYKAELLNHQTDKNHLISDLNKSQNKKESVDDVFKEMSDKVPDSTTTVEEKELAISYIDRMLDCKDIPNPEYWQNKKAVIQMEIALIKNSEAINNTDNTDVTKNYSDIQNEFNDFIKTYNKENLKFDSPEDQFEYGMTYHKTCLSFIQRILNCEDLPANMKSEYKIEFMNHQFDFNNCLEDLKRYKSEQSSSV